MFPFYRLAAALAAATLLPLAQAQFVDAPPMLRPMVSAPGGYPRVSSDPALAAVEQLPIKDVRAMAERGRRDAQIQLARLLWWDGDATTPIEILRPHAEAGDASAQYLLGTYLRFRNRDMDGSRRWLGEAVRQGHPVAQETVAGLLASGLGGMEKNLSEAFGLYLSAGHAGLAHSQLKVSEMLCQGIGVARDKATGRVWFANSQSQALVPLSPKAVGCDGD